MHEEFFASIKDLPLKEQYQKVREKKNEFGVEFINTPECTKWIDDNIDELTTIVNEPGEKDG